MLQYKKEVTVMFNLELIYDELLKNKSTKLSDVVEHKGNYYYIDSCYTLDHGYETMVFACDVNGNIFDWTELYSDWYSTKEEMEIGHKAIIADIGSVLN